MTGSVGNFQCRLFWISRIFHTITGVIDFIAECRRNTVINNDFSTKCNRVAGCNRRNKGLTGTKDRAACVCYGKIEVGIVERLITIGVCNNKSVEDMVMSVAVYRRIIIITVDSQLCCSAFSGSRITG